MSIKKKLLVALLALGTVGGFGTGFAHFKHHRSHHRAHFERHVSQLCVDAARRHQRGEAPAPGARNDSSGQRPEVR